MAARAQRHRMWDAAPTEAWSGRWGLAALAFLGAYAAGTTFPAAHRWLGGLAYHVPPLVALCLVPAVILRTGGRERAGWVAIGILLLTWDAAEWVYSWESLVHNGEVGIPSVADLLYYLGYAAFVAALPLLAGSGRRLRHPQVLIDAAIVATVAGTLSWHFLLRPVLPGSDASAAELVTFGYPVFDLVLAAALILAVYTSGRQLTAPMRWLLAAAGVLLLTDAAYLVQASETVAQASWLDVGWLAGYFCIGGALRARLMERRMAEESGESRESSLGLVLPYVALCPLAITAIWHALAVAPGGYLAAGTALTGILVMVRQWLTLVENRRLYRELESRATSLAEAVAAAELLRAQAAHFASHDDLTGLLNRRAWLTEAQARPGGAIALFDVDHFKRINDRMGHVAGDQVLKEVAIRLRDAIADQGVVGRVGGEEFAVLFHCAASEARQRCEKIVASFADSPIMVEGFGPSLVTISGGLAALIVGVSGEATVAAAYEEADRALYRAKKAGRNRVLEERRAA